MSDPAFGAIVEKVADWAWALVAGLLGIIYKSNERKHEIMEARAKLLDDRIDHEVRCVRIELKGKADDSEMNRQRGNIDKLFTGQQEIRDAMNEGFSKMQTQMNQTHVALLEKLNEIGRK